ncbi:MAG: LamG domain-containing protein [Myxococcota bacterium]
MDAETAFSTTVYPLLTQYCVNCHAGAGPGFPHIAHPDVGTAYRAVVDNQKVNFATASSSRLVQRLVTDTHFCWSGDCAMDGAEMEAAIVQWANLFGFIPGTGSSGGGGTGTGTGMPSGVIASFTNNFSNATLIDATRYETDIIALWDFKEEQGEVARDLSGVMPAMDLTLEGVEWVSGGGIENISGKATSNRTDSRKLFDRIASGSGSQEYSIEAWVIPANTDQEGPARIVTYSNGTSNRNFTLGQRLYNYVLRNRSMNANIGANGTPALETADADEDLQATLQHVVATYDQVNGRQIYVNGVFTDDVDEFAPAPLINWNPDYTFVLGNETSNNRLWRGQIKLVAVFARALTPAQVLQNYQAGAVDRFTLRFGLDDWIDVGSYMEFEVSDFDAYSYQFCFPTVVTSNPNGFQIGSIRIAVNGAAPVASQSFRNVSAAITQNEQRLSELCSVVPKDLGANLDQFSVFFDVLAGNDVRVVEAPPVPAVDLSVLPPSPDIGIRDFARINDTMSEITGVDPNTPSVAATFEELEQQLPVDTNIASFVSSHQVGIAKLALEYCNELVETPALRQAFFGAGFQFDQPVPTAFAGQAEKDMIIDALVDNMIGIALATQPTLAEVAPLLNALIDQLTAGCSAATCPATRTRVVVTGTCAAVLGSAAVHIH